jgi:hypothetical protein
MNKIMDTINSLLDFLGSYQTWAKVLMLIGFVITVATMIFAPRTKQKSTEVRKELPEMIQNSTTKEEFKAKILLSKNIIADYLKEKSSYESVDLAYNVKINGEIIDLVVFYHYKEQTQIPHILFLVKFYDIGVKSIDWNLLESDWNSLSTLVQYADVKKALVNTNGFNSHLEYPHPMDPDRIAKPTIIYNQINGRRKELTQSDLAKMQEINSESDRRNNISRYIGTYDQLVDGLNFLSGRK